MQYCRPWTIVACYWAQPCPKQSRVTTVVIESSAFELDPDGKPSVSPPQVRLQPPTCTTKKSWFRLRVPCLTKPIVLQGRAMPFTLVAKPSSPYCIYRSKIEYCAVSFLTFAVHLCSLAVTSQLARAVEERGAVQCSAVSQSTDSSA